MINIIERAFVNNDFYEVRAAFIMAARRHSGRIENDAAWLMERGYEQVDAHGQLLLDDGREVARLHGNEWALRSDVHARRLADAFMRAKQRDAVREQIAQRTDQPTPPTTCAALIDGQLCGGTLVNAAVCPRCALGKQGVAATLTCDVCGHVTAIMRGEV